MIRIEIADDRGKLTTTFYTTCISGKATASPSCPPKEHIANPQSLVRWDIVNSRRDDDRRLVLLVRGCMEGIIRMKAKHEEWIDAADEWLWLDEACALKARLMVTR